ncbi:MAG: hypothetical protein K2K70_05745 [Lachnospiraceae bacterium]|nr:hypothetical protein [Lachnospiraceae bacterium]
MKNNIERSYLNTIDDTLLMSSQQNKNSLILDEKMRDKIGYVKFSIPTNNKTGNANACWMVSEFYYQHFLSQIVEGKGFDYHSSERQVILYGSDLRRENNIGNTLSLNGVEYMVIGYIPEEQPIFSLMGQGNYDSDTVRDLSSYSDSSECLLYPYNGNMYFVNDCSAWDQSSVHLSGYIIEQNETDIPGRDWIAMKDIKKNVYKDLKARTKFSGAYIVLLTVITVFVLVSVSFLQFITFPSDKAIYILCGISSLQYYFMQFILWGVILIAACILNFLVLVLDADFSFQPEYVTSLLRLMGIQMLFTLLLQFVIEIIQYKKLLVRALKDEFS